MSSVLYTTVFITDPYKECPEFMDFAPLLIEGESYVAGGVFRSIALGNPPKDIDVFFYNVGGYNNAVERFRRSKKYLEMYATPRSMGFKHISSDMVVDLVCYQFGDPYTVIDRFDFTVCKAAFFLKDGAYKFAHHPWFHKHIESKKLVSSGIIENPDAFFNRLIRYVGYGFTDIDLSTKVKLFEAIQSRDKSDPISRVSSRSY